MMRRRPVRPFCHLSWPVLKGVLSGGGGAGVKGWHRRAAQRSVMGTVAEGPGRTAATAWLHVPGWPSPGSPLSQRNRG
jgi:hypothetical protein